MLPDLDWLIAYLALGAAAGILAGMFGIGGGLLLVPILLLIFDAQHFPADSAMHMALATSMATILFTSLSSTFEHHRHGAVNWRVVRNITPGILLGTGLGALSAASISPRGLSIIFALFVCIAATQILIDKRPQPLRQLPGIAGMTSSGLLIGWISTLVSIGGGTIVVPFLIWCNVPLRNAIGTSAAIGFPVAAGGTLGYIVTGMSLFTLPAPNLGFVYLPALLWVALATVLTAPLGAIAAHRMQAGPLRKLFALLLLALAAKLMLKVL